VRVCVCVGFRQVHSAAGSPGLGSPALPSNVPLPDVTELNHAGPAG